MAIVLIFKQVNDIKSMWDNILKDASTQRHGQSDGVWDGDIEGDGDDINNGDEDNSI